MSRVATLVEAALRNAWSFSDLPWQLDVDPTREGFAEQSFFADGLRPFRAMALGQRRDFVFRETCFHLSNLLAGERSGEHLVAQVLVSTARERPLVGQIVLEWTAASLLSTLLLKSREPLLTAILRVNLKDEARHLAYSHELRGPLARIFEKRVASEMEDLVFESVRASVAALLAEPVWAELGLEGRRMRRHGLERLERLGVLARYREVVPQQLERCGFPIARLKRRLGQGLVKGLVDDA